MNKEGTNVVSAYSPTFISVERLPYAVSQSRLTTVEQLQGGCQESGIETESARLDREPEVRWHELHVIQMFLKPPILFVF